MESEETEDSLVLLLPVEWVGEFSDWIDGRDRPERESNGMEWLAFIKGYTPSSDRLIQMLLEK